MPSQAKYFLTQLKTTADIWAEVRDYPHPADRWLGYYFHHHRHRFGSRDRRFSSEVIYSLFRNKLFFEEWARTLKCERGGRMICLMAGAVEGLISEEDFRDCLAEYFERIKNGKNLYRSLMSRELPESTVTNSPEELLSLRYSFPLWMVERWVTRFGLEECEEFLQASNERPPFVIRANAIKISRQELLQAIREEGYEAEATRRAEYGIVFRERTNLFDSDAFRRGFFEVQDEGSQLVGQIVDAKPGEVVWDVCAGGGGKSLLLGAMMQNKGRIIATDIRSKKLDELRKRANRAGVHNIFPAELSQIGQVREIRKGVDKILVDAPCSGTGTLRRNPDAKWKLSEERFEKLHVDQLAILEKSLPYLKKGGKLFYVTCSVEPRENEEVVRALLERHPEFSLARQAGARDGFFKLLPHRDRTDGFFLAAIQHKE